MGGEDISLRRDEKSLLQLKVKSAALCQDCTKFSQNRFNMYIVPNIILQIQKIVISLHLERQHNIDIMKYTKLFVLFALLAFAGMAAAQNSFQKGVEYYENGKYDKAVPIFRDLAEQGDAVAQYNLGVCYENGRGVTQSYTEAVKWYTKAAEQGYAAAQCNLGVCYKNGEGVTQSYTEAVKWYTKAAEQGHAGAKEALRILNQ